MLVLLVAQLARGWRSAVLLLALAAAVSVVTLRRMENVPPPQPMAPRVLGPLVATLDRLHLRDVYADYWVAYVLDFDTRERIVAVESRFDAVRFRSGRALLPRSRRPLPALPASGGRGPPRLRPLPGGARRLPDPAGPRGPRLPGDERRPVSRPLPARLSGERSRAPGRRDVPSPAVNASVPDPPEPDAPADPYAASVAACVARARAGGGNGRFRRGYHELVEYIHRAIVPPGSTVLELGAGEGDLLAALRPASGVGVDVSGEMVALARRHHPELEFVHARAPSKVELGRSFDDIVLSDLLPYVDDLLALFRAVRRHCDPDTRVVVHSYSQLWRPLLRLLELARLKPRTPVRNWVAQEDVEGLLELAGLEVVTMTRRILLPLRMLPPSRRSCGSVLGNLWILRQLCLTYWIVARPVPEGEPRRLSVSVVVPARDEAGMIERIVAELPEFGRETELIFVEGNSRDGTRARDPAPNRSCTPKQQRSAWSIQHRARQGRRCPARLRRGPQRRADDPRRRPDRAAERVFPHSSRQSRAAAPSSSTAPGSSTGSIRAQCATSTSSATRPSRSSSAR